MKTYPIIKTNTLAPSFLNPHIKKQVFKDKAKAPHTPLKAMLLYGNKPLLAHLFDKLSNDHLRSATIAYPVISEASQPSQNFGEMWGISTRTLEYSEERNIDLCLMNLKRSGFTHVAIYHTNSLADISAPEYLLAIENDDDIYRALKEDNDFLTAEGFISRYYRDNVHALNNINKFNIDEFELGNHIYIGNGINEETIERASHLKPSRNSLIVGKHSFVNPKTDISGQACIANRCYIDEGVKLDNSVVLANTYVGKHLNLSNCMVSSHWVYNTKTDALITIDDSNLLSVA